MMNLSELVVYSWTDLKHALYYQVPTNLCTASETRGAVYKNVLTDVLLSRNNLTGVFSEYCIHNMSPISVDLDRWNIDSKSQTCLHILFSADVSHCDSLVRLDISVGAI